ncbi:hypothetical protein F5Y04DRAFT_285661 [Hypomontagnella monticulosa]|nr:hypothetical protein F5Y04DRAFT_285661 [Hypomontagnella monticulosa]
MPQLSPKSPCLCSEARHREGQVFPNKLPNELERVSTWSRRCPHIRGYNDDNISARLAVVRIVAQMTKGLTHEEEANLSERIYTQLKLERSPLIDPRLEEHELSGPMFDQLHTVMNAQLGPSYKYYLADKVHGWV